MQRLDGWPETAALTRILLFFGIASSAFRRIAIARSLLYQIAVLCNILTATRCSRCSLALRCRRGRYNGRTPTAIAITGARESQWTPKCCLNERLPMNTRTVILKAAILTVALGAMFFGSGRLARTSVADGPSQDGTEFFEKKIRPILTDNCY